MFTEQEEKAFVIIDNFLTELQSSTKGGWFNTYGKPTEYFLAKELMDKHRLITYRNPGNKMSIVDMGDNGLTIIKHGGIKKYLTSISQTKEEKENLELQQLRSDNILKTNQLIDYDTTKRQLKYSMIANVVLAVIGLIELLLLITKK